jgi:hypothetical protein
MLGTPAKGSWGSYLSWRPEGSEGCKLLPFLPSSISAVKLSHWARKHGMGYLTAWRSACERRRKRSARHRAKRILEAMCR